MRVEKMARSEGRVPDLRTIVEATLSQSFTNCLLLASSALCGAMGEGLKGARDRAQRSVVGLNCDDLELVRQGLIITLRR
jgi:hypothetical protein